MLARMNGTFRDKNIRHSGPCSRGLSRAERDGRARAEGAIKRSADNHFLKFLPLLLSRAHIFWQQRFFRFRGGAKKLRAKLL